MEHIADALEKLMQELSEYRIGDVVSDSKGETGGSECIDMHTELKAEGEG